MRTAAGLALLLCSACAAPRGTIGAVLTQKADGTLIIREAPPGLAAARAGLLPGDELLLIDGRDVRSLSTESVHRALSGEEGDPVKLTLLRNEQIVRVTLLRSAAPSSGKATADAHRAP